MKYHGNIRLCWRYNLDVFSDNIIIILILGVIFIAYSGRSARAEDDPPQVRGSMSWLTYGTTRILRDDSPFNPGNEVLKTEHEHLATDIRPSLKLANASFQLIARPQIVMETTKSRIHHTSAQHHPKSSARWNEVFGTYNASERVILSYGTQNYQWGAAESLNPSNRIYHESVSGKTSISMVESKNIARVNLTWNKNLSTVLISETEPTDQYQAFREGQEFETQALIKNELNWNQGVNYVGVVYGASETGSPWIGEYFNVSFDNGLSFYADVAHQRNSRAWYPVVEKSSVVPGQNMVTMRQSKSQDGEIYHLGVAGARFSFENGSDLRLEYIKNSAGWDQSEWNLIFTALDRNNISQLPSYETNIKKILLPGLEYRGRNFGLVSLRVPDALYTKDLVFYARGLRSLLDFSAVFYGSLEFSFGDSSTVFMTGLKSIGQRNSELLGVIDRSYTAGFKQDF